MNDLGKSVSEQTNIMWEIASGRPAPTTPQHPLPTEPGVYIIDRPHHHEHDHWWVGSAIFELSRTGYWAVDRKPRTADEVDAIRHGQALIALVPQSESDL